MGRPARLFTLPLLSYLSYATLFTAQALSITAAAEEITAQPLIPQARLHFLGETRRHFFRAGAGAVVAGASVAIPLAAQSKRAHIVRKRLKFGHQPISPDI